MANIFYSNTGLYTLAAREARPGHVLHADDGHGTLSHLSRRGV